MPSPQCSAIEYYCDNVRCLNSEQIGFIGLFKRISWQARHSKAWYSGLLEKTPESKMNTSVVGAHQKRVCTRVGCIDGCCGEIGLRIHADCLTESFEKSWSIDVCRDCPLENHRSVQAVSFPVTNLPMMRSNTTSNSSFDAGV